MAAVLFALGRRGLEAGVYQARVEGGRVAIISGLWPSSFADFLSIALGVVAVATLAWLTYTWIAGRRDRRRLSMMTGGPHRRPLM
jgi:hypothetical protein